MLQDQFFFWQLQKKIEENIPRTILTSSVRVAPAVVSAAVLLPAVSAAADFRPPARVSGVVEAVTLSTVVQDFHYKA
jgi:hypothetical protein